MFERFTDRSRQVMALANQQAHRHGQGIIGTEHILLGMLHEGSGVGAAALREMGVNRDDLISQVEQRLTPSTPVISCRESPSIWWWWQRKPERKEGRLPQEQHAKNVIMHAIETARSWSHRYVGTEHLLMGLLEDPTTSARQVLLEAGVTAERAAATILSVLGRTEE
jgi:ATP-dependent Clp protease ATP-binding subunit ClpC